ncbi:MAG: hypothetical protein WBA74_08630, partial [Cyclobacteriaceae bacterium]
MTIITKLIKLFFILFFVQASCFGNSENSILAYHTEVTVKNGKLIRDVSYLIEVVDKSSDWISDISINYDRNESVEIREA